MYIQGIVAAAQWGLMYFLALWHVVDGSDRMATWFLDVGAVLGLAQCESLADGESHLLCCSLYDCVISSLRGCQRGVTCVMEQAGQPVALPWMLLPYTFFRVASITGA